MLRIKTYYFYDICVIYSVVFGGYGNDTSKKRDEHFQRREIMFFLYIKISMMFQRAEKRSVHITSFKLSENEILLSSSKH